MLILTEENDDNRKGKEKKCNMLLEFSGWSLTTWICGARWSLRQIFAFCSRIFNDLKKQGGTKVKKLKKKKISGVFVVRCSDPRYTCKHTEGFNTGLCWYWGRGAVCYLSISGLHCSNQDAPLHMSLRGFGVQISVYREEDRGTGRCFKTKI